MRTDTDPQKIKELLTRGVEEVIHIESLQAQLASGKELRVKLGIDPTSPHVHIGRSVPLLKLRDFQKLGHKIIFIVGDFTGVIGDTSDKESERPMLSGDVIEENKKTYLAQVAKILDIDSVEFRYNTEWLGKLTYTDVAQHADAFSVAEFIARDNIKRRLDAGKRVSLREVLYPLMQGYDSVAVHADVEIGGTDQRFNLLAGRVLQEQFGQKPQNVLTNPLINGTDGRKMSSSWGNTITLTMEANDMYGKVMSVADSELITYFTVCTRAPLTDIEDMRIAMEGGENPRNVKMKLAHEIVRMYHGVEKAHTAESAFIETFQKGNIPGDIPEIGAPYIENMVRISIVPSKTELRRLIDAGGVREADTDFKLAEFPQSVPEPLVLKIGKRRFVKLLP